MRNVLDNFLVNHFLMNQTNSLSLECLVRRCFDIGLKT